MNLRQNSYEIERFQLKIIVITVKHGFDLLQFHYISYFDVPDLKVEFD